MTLEAQKLEKMLTKSLQHHPPSSHNCSQQKLVKNENLKIIRGPHEFDFWAIIHYISIMPRLGSLEANTEMKIGK